MPFIRRLYEGHGPEWKGIEESQAYLDRKRAQLIGPDCDRFVLTLLKQGYGFIDTRKIWGAYLKKALFV